MRDVPVVLTLKPFNFHHSVVIRMVPLMNVFAAVRNTLNNVWLFSCISTRQSSLTLRHTLATVKLLRIIKWLISHIQRLCHELVPLPTITIVLLGWWLKRVLSISVRSWTSLRHREVCLWRLNCSEIWGLSLWWSHRSSWLWMDFHNISIKPLRVDKHILLACTITFKTILVSFHTLSILILWIVSCKILLKSSLITSWWLLPCLLHFLEIDESRSWSLIQRLRLLTYTSWCWLRRNLHLLALNSCWLLPVWYNLRWFLRLLLCHLIWRACLLLWHILVCDLLLSNGNSATTNHFQRGTSCTTRLSVLRFHKWS